MTGKYRFFVKDINIVAPKPTTYRVTLNNDYDFLLIYAGNNNYRAKVAGKQYDLSIAGEITKASQAITDLLINGKKPQLESDMPTGGPGAEGGDPIAGGGGSMSGGDFDSGPTDGVFEPLDGNSDNPLDEPDGDDPDTE